MKYILKWGVVCWASLFTLQLIAYTLGAADSFLLFIISSGVAWMIADYLVPDSHRGNGNG